MRGHCPKGKLSCIGVYRRNVITLKETSRLIFILCFSSFIDSVIQAVFPNLDKILDGKVLFWIWNIKGISFNEGLFLTLPLLLEIPIESEPTKGKPYFYVSAPDLLLPRPPNLSSHPMPSSCVRLPPSKPSTSSKMTMNEAEVGNPGRKETGLILSTSTAPQPSSSSERKGFPKGEKSSKLMLSIPTNKPRNDFCKKYRTTYYCKRHNQVERVESES